MRNFSTVAAAVARGVRSSQPIVPKRILTIGVDENATKEHYVIPQVLKGLVENGMLNGKKIVIGLDRDFGNETQESRNLMASAQRLFDVAPPRIDIAEVTAKIIDRHVAEAKAYSSLPEELIRMEAVNLIRNILWERFEAQTGHQVVPLSKGKAELEAAKDLASIKLGDPKSAEILGRYAKALTQEITGNILDIANQGATTIINCVSAVNCAQIASICKHRGASDSVGANLAAAGYDVLDPFLFVSELDGVPTRGSSSKSEIQQKMKNSIKQSPLATKVTVKTFNATNTEEKLIEQMSAEINAHTINVVQPQSGSRLDGRGNDGAHK